MNYYEITDATNEMFEPNIKKFENIRKPGACLDCGILPEFAGPPNYLEVKCNIPQKTKITFTSWGFGAIHIDLIRMLGSSASDNLSFGHLYLPNGAEVKEYRTFVGKERILLRGTKKSLYGICQTCGSLYYTYLPRNRPYLTRSSLESLRSIYEEESMILIVNEDVKSILFEQCGASVNIREINILDEVLDGLPNKLSIWPNSADSKFITESLRLRSSSIKP